MRIEDGLDDLKNWQATSKINHWKHDEGYSIRATHPNMYCHIGPKRGGWIIEVYPANEWPILSTEAQVWRYYPEGEINTRRVVAALMLAVSIAEGRKD